MTTVPTVKECFDEYLKVRSPKPETVKNYTGVLRICISDWYDKPLNKISYQMVIDRYTEISIKTPRQANYCMSILRALFNFALDYYEDENGNPIIHKNPVRKLKAVKKWTNNKSRLEDSIAVKDLGIWFRAVQSLKSDSIRDLLIFLLLTGLRKNEASLLTWQNVDLVEGSIMLKPARTKNKLLHKIPLSDYLIDMLKRRKEISSGEEYVFPSPVKPNSPIVHPYEAIQKVTERCGVRFRPHDLRRTFATLATHPKINAGELTIKTLLNHVGGDMTRKHYMKVHPERLRATVQAVTDFVLAKAGEVSMPSLEQKTMSSRPARKTITKVPHGNRSIAKIGLLGNVVISTEICEED